MIYLGQNDIISLLNKNDLKYLNMAYFNILLIAFNNLFKTCAPLLFQVDMIP